MTGGRQAGRVAGGLLLPLVLSLAVHADPAADEPQLAAAQPATPQQLREAEQARAAELAAQRQAVSRAAAAKAEAQRLAARQVAALERLREAENATSATATRVEALAQRQREAEARLALRAADVTPLLPLLERLAMYPTETFLAVPLPPEQAVRGALVLGGVMRELEREARALQAEKTAVAELQAQIERELPRLSAAQAVQAQAAQALDEQLRSTQADRRAAEDEAAQAARRAAAEAARADGLRTAIARIEAERRAAEAQARREAEEAARQRRTAAAASARSRQAALAAPAGPGLAAPSAAAEPAASNVSAASAAAPVAGSLLRGFGDPTEAGPSTGIAYLAAPAARVVAPCGGRAVFAGPFRSYGLLLIIDCGGGYHFVLAGFDRLDAQVGQSVAAGAPVGVMPAWDPRASAARPSLYVELRRDGHAVNPAPFLRAKG